MAEIKISLKDLFGDGYGDMISDLLTKIKKNQDYNDSLDSEVKGVCFFCECELTEQSKHTVCEDCSPKAKEIKKKIDEFFS